MGRRWRPCWRWRRGNSGSGALGSRRGASESGSGAIERVRRSGASVSKKAVGGSTARRGEREHCRLQNRASLWDKSDHSGGVGRAWGATRGAAGYWGGVVPHPPWICGVRVWRRVRWMWRWWRQVVRVQWLLGGLSRLGVGLGSPFGLHVVARRIRFLVGGGQSLVVGGVVVFSAWWVVLPSHALKLFVHGRLWAGGVAWWAVVVVVVGVVMGSSAVVMVVVVVAGVLVALVGVMGVVVVVVVLLVFP